MKTDKEWRGILGDQRASLLADLNLAAESSAPVELDQSRVGRLSRMDAMQAQEMSRAADLRRQVELQQIEAALTRIDDGTFGDCVRCGEPIAANRLAFAPANPLCLQCAESLES